MGKPNAFIAKIEARHQRELYRQRLFTLQYAQDAALIALADEFGFGPERATRFCLSYMRAVNEISKLIHDDGLTDRDVEYARGVIDRKLRGILGENFAPWEVRYGGV